MHSRPNDETTRAPRGVSRRDFLQTAGVVAGAGLALGEQAPALAQPSRRLLAAANSEFDVAFEAGVIVALRRVNDAFDTNYVQSTR